MDSLDALVGGTGELAGFFDSVLEAAASTEIYHIVDQLQLTFQLRQLFTQWDGGNLTEFLVGDLGYPRGDLDNLANVSLTLQPVIMINTVV